MTLEDCAAPRIPRPVPNTSEKVFEQFRLNGRVVVITGASDGIGFAAAEAMAEAGADLALWYNTNKAVIEKGAQLATDFGIKVKTYQVEVSDPGRVQAAIAEVVDELGRLDVFIANAGMAISKPILEQTVEEYKKQMSVNVDGVFYCAKYAGEVFKRQGTGNLIITSSISAHIVNVPVDQPVYNCTKAAVTHLGKSLAREWRDFARVNIVSPGFFSVCIPFFSKSIRLAVLSTFSKLTFLQTKMGASPRVENEAYRMAVLGRQGHTKEIKGLYLYLASDASTYTTGSDIVIDGGYILP